MGVPIVGALKIPLAHVAADERETRRFLDEARMITVLDHPNLVRVIDAGVDQGVPFLVMQWVNGIDLLNLRKAVHANGLRFSVATSLLVAARVLAALDHAYSREVAGRRLGIVHRDVKPANILISVEGHVMLTDFGVASMIGGEATGNAHGTPRYMSPEQFRGKTTHQSDLWGVGGVLWEMLAGGPFRGDLSTQEVIEHLVSETPVRPPPLRDDFTVPLLQLLHGRLLAVLPENRFDSASVALEAVESCPGFEPRATTELAQLVRRFRPSETSGYTELMLKVLPDDGQNLEIDVIYSAASGRHQALQPMSPMGMDVEDAPTDKRTPSSPLPAAVRAPVPQASLVAAPSEPSDPTVREAPDDPLPRTEMIVKAKPPIPEPEPDAPTQLRRPQRKPKRVDVFLPDIAGVIDTPLLVPRPDNSSPPSNTHRLSDSLAPPPNPGAHHHPTDVIPPHVVASILASMPPPSRDSSSYVARQVHPLPETSASFDMAPLLAPYQKWFIVGLLFAFLAVGSVAVLALNW
jgi:serine/threonine-protein kinase